MSRLTLLTPILCAALALASCGERSVTGNEDSGAPPRDKGASYETHAVPDHGDKRDRIIYPPDRPLPPDHGVGPNFCAGSKPKLEVNGQTVQVSTLSTYINYQASCCGPGEVLEFKGLNASGSKANVLFYSLRFPNVKLPPQIKIDLAKPPGGWVFGVQCSAGSGCTGATLLSNRFSGTWDMRSLLGGPAVEIALCADIKPGTGSGGKKDRIRLYSPRVTVNTACVPGMDQTCNFDPAVSSFRGKCSSNSTCTCFPPAQKMPNGKCK